MYASFSFRPPYAVPALDPSDPKTWIPAHRLSPVGEWTFYRPAEFSATRPHHVEITEPVSEAFKDYLRMLSHLNPPPPEKLISTGDEEISPVKCDAPVPEHRYLCYTQEPYIKPIDASVKLPELDPCDPETWPAHDQVRLNARWVRMRYYTNAAMEAPYFVAIEVPCENNWPEAFSDYLRMLSHLTPLV